MKRRGFFAAVAGLILAPFTASRNAKAARREVRGPDWLRAFGYKSFESAGGPIKSGLLPTGTSGIQSRPHSAGIEPTQAESLRSVSDALMVLS